MKLRPHRIGLFLFAVVLAVVLFGTSGRYQNGHIVLEPIAIGAGSSVTIMSAQTTIGPGPSGVHTALTPAETGAERWFFTYTGTAGAAARIERSVDGGTTWASLYRFGGTADQFDTPVCGTCLFRAYAVIASATKTSTVTAIVSGVPVAF